MVKDKEKIIKKAINRGWYLDREKRHCIYKHKKGGCVTVSKTVSERRAWLEIKKDFRRQEKLFH